MTPPSAEYEPAPPRFDDSVRRHAVLGPAERDAGVRVTVVELHDGGVTVYWHFACDDHEPRAAAAWERITDDEEGPHPLAEHEPRPLVVLADDRGTEYRRAASYYSYDPRDRCAHGRHGFAPAVPERATRLHVAIGDVARIAVPLVPDAQAS